jgi:hypothetical protein
MKVYAYLQPVRGSAVLKIVLLIDDDEQSRFGGPGNTRMLSPSDRFQGSSEGYGQCRQLPRLNAVKMIIESAIVVIIALQG